MKLYLVIENECEDRIVWAVFDSPGKAEAYKKTKSPLDTGFYIDTLTLNQPRDGSEDY